MLGIVFNRETFVIVKCAVVVVGPGTDKQLPVPQFRGLEWRGGGGSHPPVGQFLRLPFVGKVWLESGGGEKSRFQRVAGESKLRSPPRQILFYYDVPQLLFFLRPFVLHFSAPSFLQRARRKQHGERKMELEWEGE